VDAERRELEAEYERCLGTLASEAEAAEDHAAAAGWWRRLVAQDRYDSAAVVSLMNALAAAGDPANAVQFAEDHIRLLDEEFGMGPPAPVLDKIGELRAAAAPVHVPPRRDRPARGIGVIEVERAPIRADTLRPRTALAMAAVVAVLAAAWAATSRPESVVEYIPNAVMVGEVENLTGDSTLGPTGRYAAYLLEGGLASLDEVRVVRAEDAAGIREDIEELSDLAGVDLVREMARHTRAGLMVESSFIRQDDTLRLEARLVAPSTGEVLEGFRASTSVHDPESGLQVLAERVMVAVATRLQLGEQYARSYGRGTSFRAWQEVDAAREMWLERGREREAFALLKRALVVDSTFDAARGLAAIWHLNFGEFEEAAAMAVDLERRLPFLGPRQRWQLAAAKAVLRQDRAALVDAFQDWATRLPNASRLLHLASIQRVAQRPRACIETLDRVDLEGSRYFRSAWKWLLYAECHRFLGDYDRSLEQIRAGRERFPERRNLVVPEVKALAGIGRSADAEALIDQYLASPAAGETFEHERVFAMLVDGALTMRAAGDPLAAERTLGRAVNWYRTRSTGDSASAADRWYLARSLYAAGRWEEAREAFDALTVEDLAGHHEIRSHNVDVSLLGYRAALSARLGDRDEADALDARLASLRRPHLWGHATYWRAAIAAARGDPERATELLDQSISEGLFATPWGTEYPKWEYPVDPDFGPLMQHEPLRALVSPRG
jgi:tetratricopeptide (TPR) repeat protein